MVFSSIPFLFFFLPVVLLVYFITPNRYKNVSLLLASVLFYAWGEPENVWIMSGSVLTAYLSGIFIEKYKGTSRAKIFCGVSVAIELFFLFYFKYTDFLIETMNRLTGIGIPLLHIALPAGISFYTFQLISYTVDVYRGVAAQKNFVNLAVYVAMFPQLIAGPIVRYHDLKDSISKRQYSAEDTALGIRRFITGLAKKVLIADQMGELCEIFKESTDRSVLFYWMYALAFAIYIYFDFSGYSDMAIGLGRILGFHFLENFNFPYISGSITEFWRRWHISLGTWFRDYVYIPLGGNRVKPLRHVLNIAVVWILTGSWHGAAWNFALWGLYFAVLLVIEKKFLAGWLNRHRVCAHIYTIFFLLISFVIFRADSLLEICTDLSGMFGVGGVPLFSKEAWYYLRSYAVLFGIGMLGATPIVRQCGKQIPQKVKNGLEPVALFVLLILVTAFLVDGSFHPFLYFRF